MGSSTSDFDEPCPRCGRRKCEGGNDPRCLTPAEEKEASVVKRLREMESENGVLRAMLRKFVDEDGCLLDAEGRCKSHIQVPREHRKPCAVREARELLTK